MSNGQKGMIHTQERIEKTRQSKLLIRDQISKAVSIARTGMKHSPEAKENIRKAALLREQRKREKYDINC